jgi:TPR repeat protein
MEELNGGFEITSSIVTAQQRNEVAARQASSDATPARVGALERTGPLTPPDSHQVQTRSATSSAEEDKLIARANSLIKQFDFVGARLLLAYALEKGSARAAFIMAETYDWQILRSMHASGARGDDQIARKFYQLAAAAGIEKAQERLEALQPDANAELR